MQMSRKNSASVCVGLLAIGLIGAGLSSDNKEDYSNANQEAQGKIIGSGSESGTTGSEEPPEWSIDTDEDVSNKVEIGFLVPGSIIDLIVVFRERQSELKNNENYSSGFGSTQHFYGSGYEVNLGPYKSRPPKNSQRKYGGLDSGGEEIQIQINEGDEHCIFVWCASSPTITLGWDENELTCRSHLDTGLITCTKPDGSTSAPFYSSDIQGMFNTF